MTLFLLDTHLVLWTAGLPERLSKQATALIEDEDHEIAFSVISIWEIAIKACLRRSDFEADARELRGEMIDRGFQEFLVNSNHAIAISRLPRLHRDPFDRMLIAQADVEGATLLTADARVGAYPYAVRLV